MLDSEQLDSQGERARAACAPGPERLPIDGVAARRLETWLDGHAIAMTLAVIATGIAGDSRPIAWIAALSFCLGAVRLRTSLRAIRPVGGFANHLTAIRLVAALTAAGWQPEIPGALLLTLFTVNVVLDVADGHIARRMRQETSIGAAFDREVDAAFVLVAYAWFYCTGVAGAWILLPGLLPWLWRIVMRILQPAQQQQTRESLAVLLAGVNFGLLIAAIAASAGIRDVLLITSATVVGCSFAVSFVRRINNAD